MIEPKQAPNSRSVKPIAVELFAGAGLLSHALKREGFTITFAVELDPICCKTYRRNVGHHIVCSDVRNASYEGPCDILVAGPPCQGFSTLNRKRHNDVRQLLTYEVVNWVERLKPSVVAIENVAAFLETEHYQAVRDRLERLGYLVEARVLDAADFGVPQFRRRSFLVASKLGPLEWPKTVAKTVSVRQAWKGLSEEPDGANMHTAPIPSPLALSRMMVINPGGDKRDVMAARPELGAPSWFRLGVEITDVWGRLHWDRPSNTLRTAMQNPSKGRYIHPEQNRVISLREAARLHSIPDSWVFEGSPTQIARQLGNSVPPKLGRALAKQLRALF